MPLSWLLVPKLLRVPLGCSLPPMANLPFDLLLPCSGASEPPFCLPSLFQEKSLAAFHRKL